MSKARWLSCVCLVVVSGTLAAAEIPELSEFPKLSAETDWPWWRGPHRNGIASSDPVPTDLGPGKNVLWKTPVPGRGHGSPIIARGKIFLPSADEQQKIHGVFAFDLETGKQEWAVEVNRGGFPARNHAKNTEASPTIATDGERLYASFFHHEKIEVVALNPDDGKVLWKQVAGPFSPKRFEYGYAPSPLIYKNSVIISGEYDGSSFLTALNRETGKPLWKTARPNNITFSSPVVAHVAGRDQLLLSGGEQVASYDPATGKQLWTVQGTTFATCGTMVWTDDIVIASGGYPKAETIAVKADGSRQVLWKNNQKCYEQSMIVIDGYVYALTDQGVLFCWRATDGQEMWKQRLSGPVSASPVYAGGNIYWANEAGSMYVFRPNPEKFDPVAENDVGESFASPAVSQGKLFLRVADRSSGVRQEYLYCFGKK